MNSVTVEVKPIEPLPASGHSGSLWFETHDSKNHVILILGNYKFVFRRSDIFSAMGLTELRD